MSEPLRSIDYIDSQHLPVSIDELRVKGVEMKGPELALRPLQIEDAPFYFNLIDYDRDHLSQFSDDTASKYQTVEDVSLSITNPDNSYKLRFGIWDEDTMVGTINLEPGENGQAHIGYWIGKKHTGHRYAAKALAVLADFASTNLGYSELLAEADRDNTASRKTLAAGGFEETGELIGRVFSNNGLSENFHIFILYRKSF